MRISDWSSDVCSSDLIGLSLGADVPVFVRGLAAWAEGVGERLRPVTIDEPWYLIVTPPVAVRTAEIFRAPELPRAHPRIDRSEERRVGKECVRPCRSWW